MRQKVSVHVIGIEDTIIRSKYDTLQVHKTKGFHRKLIKRHLEWDENNQKVEAIFSCIKRMVGYHIMSGHIVAQNMESLYRMIGYNCYRITRNHLVGYSF